MNFSAEHLKENLWAWQSLAIMSAMGVPLSDGLFAVEEEYESNGVTPQFSALVSEVERSRGLPPQEDWHPEAFLQAEKSCFAVGWATGMLEMGLDPCCDILRSHILFHSGDTKISRSDLFFYQFYRLLTSSQPILQVLSILEHDLNYDEFQDLITQSKQTVTQGGALASVFKDFRELLPSGFAEAFESFEKQGEIETLRNFLKDSQTGPLFKAIDDYWQNHAQSEKVSFYQSLSLSLHQGQSLQDAFDGAFQKVTDADFKDRWKGVFQLFQGDFQDPVKAMMALGLTRKEALICSAGFYSGALDLAFKSLVALKMAEKKPT